MNRTIKFMAGALIALTFSGNAHAAKWKELVFTEDINGGLSELAQYCMTHDVDVADVLWANSIDSSDIKPGQSVYLPANHADMLAIWQHKGAWQPKALVPVTSAAAAKRASKNKSQLKEVPMPKIAGIPDLQTLLTQPSKPEQLQPAEQETSKLQAPEPAKNTAQQSAQPANVEALSPEESKQTEDTAPPELAQKSAEEKSNDEIIAMLREEVKTDAKNLPPEQSEQSEQPAPVQAEKTEAAAEIQPVKAEQAPLQQVQTVKKEDIIPVQPIKSAKKKQESPSKVIANTAKPDKILTSKPRKTAKQEIPGLMDPIIILSPNGDAAKGPMRLVISGDKVEVVQLPKSAAPKKPSLSDLDHTFGTNPSYLPHYNLTPKKRDPFILNMGNLAGKMLWPVDGKVSSPFGKWRGSHKHQGIDIPMPAGTPIRAAKNGVVSRTGNNSTMGFRGYGNFVLMDHGDGVQTFYAHCLSVAVVQGQRIMQGQIIGYVGSTGRSTANHLHFEVRVNSTKVDPMRYLAGNTQLASTK